MDGTALKKINRQRYALDAARVIVGLVMIVPYLASIAAAVLGFLGNDIEIALYGVGAYAVTAFLSAVIDVIHDRASKGFEAKRLRYYTGRTWLLPNGRTGHFTDVSYNGGDIRLCDEDGNNEWHSAKTLSRIQPSATRKSDAEIRQAADDARKKLVSIGIRAGGALAAIIFTGLAHDVVFAYSDESASAAEIAGYLAYSGWPFAAILAYFSFRAGREFTTWLGALEDGYEGRNWTTPESSVGRCVAVWPYPERLTLKFANGVTREYDRDQLAMAA